MGASGGIGDAIQRALASNPNCSNVIGLSRRSEPRFDLEDESSIEHAAKVVAQGGNIQLLIDATGVLHGVSMKPEKSILAVDPEAIALSFATNATGPLLLLKHFHPLLPRVGRSVFATLSARVGSIEDNSLGGWYGYRASKAALNMFVRCASIEIARKRPEAICLALHPGTVRTSLSEPYSSKANKFQPDQAAAMLLEVIDRATTKDNGAFLAYDGSRIPW